MSQRLATLAASLFAGAAACGLLAAPALAQIDPSGMAMHHAQELGNPASKTAPVAPPPALPGARGDVVAPATKLPSDLSPNEALFDAINRGDIATARDALSRGADLGAHNVLGLTPMELSVDLGRNDISFLLLSYRNPDSVGAGAPKAMAGAKTAPAAPAQHVAAKPAPRSAVVPVKAAEPVQPQRPRLFANDGGAPVPGAGFLGFDAGRPGR